MSPTETDIAARLAPVEPDVEVLRVDRLGGELRVYIDHPGGVDLTLCERVTGHLRGLLVDYRLTVSSPGADRPLTRLEHYRRFLGRRIRLRTTRPIDGRRTFTGRLAAAEDEHVAIEVEPEPVSIALSDIHRSNLVPEAPGGSA